MLAAVQGPAGPHCGSVPRDQPSAEHGHAPAKSGRRDRGNKRVARAAEGAVVDDVHRIEELIDGGEDHQHRANARESPGRRVNKPIRRLRPRKKTQPQMIM